MDAIAPIRATKGMNKRLAASLLVSNLTKFTYSCLCFNIPEQQLLDENTTRILCGYVIDSEYDIKVVSGVHVLNSRGNR